MKLLDELRVRPGDGPSLDRRDPGARLGADSKSDGLERLAKLVERLGVLHNRLYAEARRSVLLVLQGMDASGKDGVIRTVFTGVNPQGCRVEAFKAPTADELAHDFLWRVHRAAPRSGEIGIFNRSHYEDVLVVRVHKLAPKSVWSRRYDEINDFERTLTEGGTTIVKFFLSIDRDEQRARFQARYDDPTKRWKFSMGDLEERKLWDDYQAAFDDALNKTSTASAPWYVIPANRNWFRNLAVATILADTMADLKPAYPPAPDLPPDLVIE